MLILFSHFLHMRSNNVFSQLTNENHIIKLRYNELYTHCKEIEEKIAELLSAQTHHPPCLCSQHPRPVTGNESGPSDGHLGSIDYKGIIQSLESKILELNKQIIEQNKHIRELQH